jgi:hypothetical protein
MTTEERFERIENELTVIVQAQHGIVESQRIQAETLSQSGFNNASDYRTSSLAGDQRLDRGNLSTSYV